MGTAVLFVVVATNCDSSPAVEGVVCIGQGADRVATLLTEVYKATTWASLVGNA
jgi:hypothetical protein